MSPITQILILGVGSIVLIALVIVVFEWRNRVGIRKRRTEATVGPKVRGYRECTVQNCNSCPCYRNWCGPVCGLDHTLIYGKQCEYVAYSVHPKCPLRRKHYILSYKSDPGSRTLK